MYGIKKKRNETHQLVEDGKLKQTMRYPLLLSRK